MQYTSYSYLWPTRPSNAIAPTLLGFYEKRGWVAQIKKNGTNCPVFRTDKEVIFKTRHNADHKQWVPTQEIIDFFMGFPAWSVFNTELLHSKTKHIKNKIFVHDIVAYDGEQLVGSTFMERQELLQKIMGMANREDCFSHVEITPDVWLAKVFHGKFTEVFDAAVAFTEDEGLVLKNPEGKLKQCVSETSNTRWMIKCRKPHKNYAF